MTFDRRRVRLLIELLAVVLLSCQSPRPKLRIADTDHGEPRGIRLSCDEVSQDEAFAYAFKVPIRYPDQLPSDHEVGFVVLGFDIDDLGNPVNVHVVRASLGHRFDDASVEAFRKWKFCPREFGKKDQTLRIQFKAGCSSGHQVGCR